MTPTLDIILIAILVSVSCAIPGVFLVLRRVAMMSDAISHSILLGIVLMFFLVRSTHSPLLLVGAVLTGMATVWITERIIHTRRLKEDAAIGLVFPTLFSIAIILISRYTGMVHIDQDAVLLGEIAFAPFNRLMIAGRDVGPVAAWTMGGVLIVNLTLASLLYKELKVSTFDPAFSATLGISPAVMYYLLMGSVSITSVAAFDAVGSILVVALMITPAATAYLLTHNLFRMVVFSSGIGAASAIAGYGLSMAYNTSIAGAMAAMTGFFFLGALFVSPKAGWVWQAIRHQRQKIDFAVDMLVVQLLSHVNDPDPFETTIQHLSDHMGWPNGFGKKVVNRSIILGYVSRNKTRLSLTDLGREVARVAMSGRQSTLPPI